MPPTLEQAKVAGLMDPNHRQWDEEVLKYICNERDAELIRKIPLSINCEEDSWFWILEASGVFSVRSCYRKVQGEQVWDQSVFWKKLWTLESVADPEIFFSGFLIRKQ